MPESVRIDQPVSIRGWTPGELHAEISRPGDAADGAGAVAQHVSAQLTAEVGPAAVAATARRLGITSPLQATPSIALGTSEVTLLELTGAFVPFANGGQRRHPACHQAHHAPTGGKRALRALGLGPGPGGRPGLCRHDERDARARR